MDKSSKQIEEEAVDFFKLALKEIENLSGTVISIFTKM